MPVPFSLNSYCFLDDWLLPSRDDATRPSASSGVIGRSSSISGSTRQTKSSFMGGDACSSQCFNPPGLLLYGYLRPPWGPVLSSMCGVKCTRSCPLRSILLHSSATSRRCCSPHPEAIRVIGPFCPASFAANQSAMPCQCWYPEQSVLNTK